MTLTVLRSEPRVFVVDDFVSEAEVVHILALAGDLGIWESSGVKVHRDSTGTSFELPVVGDVLTSVTRRTYDLLGETNALGASVRFRSYQVGEAHPPHTDSFEALGYWLVATAMIVLEEPTDGGETEFERAVPPLRLEPRRRRLSVWLNHLPDGAVDPASFHSGLPVNGGVKTTITNFIYAPLDCALVREGPKALWQ